MATNSNRTFSSVFNTQHAAPQFLYLFDPNTVVSGGGGDRVTGGWRNANPGDFAANVSVSGLSVSVGAVAVTGLPTFSVVGPVSVTGTQTVTVINPLAITGSPSVTVLNPISVTGLTVNTTSGPIAVTGGAINATIVNGPPIAISGVVNATVTLAPIAVTGGSITVNNPLAVTGGSIAVTNATESVQLLAISGLLASNLTEPANVTGAVSIIGSHPVQITGSPTVTMVNPVAITGSPTVMVGNGVVPVSGVVTVGNTVTTTSTISNPVAVSGGSITVNNGVVPVSGVVTVGNTVTTSTTVVNPLAVTGAVSVSPNGGIFAISGVVTAGVSNPIGITGTRYDTALPTMPGVANFLPIGGRMTNPSGAGSITGYNNTGDFAILNISPGGGVYVNQGVLDRTQDAVTTYLANANAVAGNSVSGINNVGWGVALGSNVNRLAWGIQNLSTGIVRVRFASTLPTTGTAHIFLKGGTVQNDALGASWIDSPAVYTGPVAVSGDFFVAPTYSIWEM